MGSVAKDRISLLFTVNATGTDKRKPLVIGKSFRPRGFPQNLPSDFPVDYESNCKAWMTGEVWTRYLKKCSTPCSVLLTPRKRKLL